MNYFIFQVESLLNQLAEVNTRYCEVRPSVDVAEARVRELEAELETVKTELSEQKALLNEQEERNKQMYLKMYAKGQEAARIEQADQVYYIIYIIIIYINIINFFHIICN